MNRIEWALMYALESLHHRTDKAIDFRAIAKVNQMAAQRWPGALLVGPGDDAAVFQMPGIDGLFAGKMESHCSPCVSRPYDAAATGAGGAMRDVTAMGAQPIFLMDSVENGRGLKYICLRVLACPQMNIETHAVDFRIGSKYL